MTVTTPPAAALCDALAEPLRRWLPRQRWYAGKDGTPHAVRVAQASMVFDADPALLHAVLAVDDRDRVQLYQVLLGVRADPPTELAEAGIARVGAVSVYPAERDGELMQRLLDLFTGRGRPATGLRLSLEPGVQLDAPAPARLIAAEQSNTSVVFGERYILKLFRRLTAGPNPDLDVHRGLTRVGCRHVAGLLGSAAGQLPGGEPVVLGILQRFMPGAAEGWQLATQSVRALAGAAASDVAAIQRDFVADARLLGAALAEVHGDLARAFGRVRLPPSEVRAAVAEMHRRLDTMLAATPQLAGHEAALRRAYARVAGQAPTMAVQRIHGDLHLGQTLRARTGWLFIDFEGEPAVPLAERNAPHSTLQDVAGMLRSFDYAAQQLLVERPVGHGIEARVSGWARASRDAFCDGYGEVLDDPRDQAALLKALELHRAVYEVGYELANRPDWVAVPMRSIARLLVA